MLDPCSGSLSVAQLTAGIVVPWLDEIASDDLSRRLTYAGLVLLAYELVKSMIVGPIKLFYRDVTFGDQMPFKSYEVDVLWRHRNEFEACVLYLRDFMSAIDSADVLAVHALRKHRNELAHDLATRLPDLQIHHYRPLFAAVERVLFKLSKYRAYMEIGADPNFSHIDWSTAKGHEYALFEAIMAKVGLLEFGRGDAQLPVQVDGDR